MVAPDSPRTAPAANGVPPRPPRGWVKALALAVLTGIALYFCYQLAVPFLPGITWAVALAAIGFPFHARVRKYIPSDNWAAGVSLFVVLVVIVVPILVVASQLAHEAAAAQQKVQEQAASGKWRDTLARVPVAGEWLVKVDRQVNLEQEARRYLARLGEGSMSILTGSLQAVLQMLVAVFILFFCFRDRGQLLAGVRALLPLEPGEAERVITRADGAIRATVNGTILTGVLQGVTGGLLFWAVGLPAPVLWGVVMTILSVIPVLGAFMVWVPAAAYLATEERFGAATALVAWGLLMAGPICNAIYAYVAGGQMKLHPAPALLAFIGGLATFGVSGMVLGPVILAVAAALIGLWHERLHRPADPPRGDAAPIAVPAGAMRT